MVVGAVDLDDLPVPGVAMTSTTRGLPPRQTGVRSGVGEKPQRVQTAVLSSTNPAIRPNMFVGHVLRVTQTSASTGNVVLGFGRFDGQRILLLSVDNNGDAILPNDTASTVVLAQDWDMAENSTLPLVWDARQRLWLQATPLPVAGDDGADGADGESPDDLLELIRWLFRRVAFINAALGIEYGQCEEAIPDAVDLVEDDAWM